jgi:hypothetical protein
MCGRCCRNSGEACDIHEDSLDVYIPPTYESSHKFYKIEPSANFENKKKFEEFISVKKPVSNMAKHFTLNDFNYS